MLHDGASIQRGAFDVIEVMVRGGDGCLVTSVIGSIDGWL